MDAISREAAAFLVVWLEAGGNVTIIGETGTGKTTLMNALDERIDPRLRRIYIEDAVETRDLLEKGYHQLKIKVDPVDRGGKATHSKESEVVKVLHRSPDLVLLSEIQSEEHSRAFFHSLSAGIRGMQTFHASSVEQAIRRWTTSHGISKVGLLDLGIMVQMARPDRLGPSRFVTRICVMVSEDGEPRLREIFARDREGRLVQVQDWNRIPPPGNEDARQFMSKARQMAAALETTMVLAN
jgi:type IV secretory pathway ATPase VirB11/archaellum biosynthesis ATPase